jgi:integrase
MQCVLLNSSLNEHLVMCIARNQRKKRSSKMKIPQTQKANGEAKSGSKPSVIALLNRELEKNARTRTDGNVASHSTATTRGQSLRTIFTNLKEIGYRLEDPQNLGEKHIQALAAHWHKEGKAISTIQSRLSALRIFAKWIGKKGMVKSLEHYLPDVPKKELKVKKIAAASKGWSENDIDIKAKIREADQLDPLFGLMLRAELAFGLRRKEVLHLKPWKSDKGDKLAIYEAKNGRPRDVYIETQEQRQLLDQLKECVKKGDSLSWKTTLRGKDADLEYNLGRYNKSMAKIGITKEETGTSGHGLRAQFAENMALILQMIPPTLGGTGGQMSKEDLNLKRSTISELLGHGRISITASYYGSFGRDATQDEADRCKNNIEKAIMLIQHNTIEKVEPARLQDCIQMIGELALIEVDATPSQIQYLWKMHSARHGADWIQPGKGNAIAIEVAAIKLSEAMGQKN